MRVVLVACGRNALNVVLDSIKRAYGERGWEMGSEGIERGDGTAPPGQ
jgi:hypothetical protein